MEARSTPRHLLDWMRRLHRPFLILVLVPIALFVMAPQMALVDSDDDGITDLSAIAIGASIAYPSSSTCKDQRPYNSHETVILPSDATQSRCLGTAKSEALFPDGHSVRTSLCLLRC